jgi:protein-S-isoprenylcysteine O-methyltransferase Ste14
MTTEAQPISPWIPKAVVLAASVLMIVIRAPHGHRSRKVRTVRSCKGRREVILLALVWVGFFIPLIWVFSPALSFGEYPLRFPLLIAGGACLAAGLLLFHRSHADLGKYWSITLEVREAHELITQGVYRRVRHPMYSALFLYSIGQMLALPNWVAGPSYLVSFGILFALRIGAEEHMMRDAFGDQYIAYMARTKRLVPGIW